MKETIFSIQISEEEEEEACPPSPALARVGTTLEEEEGCRPGSQTGKQKRIKTKKYFCTLLKTVVPVRKIWKFLFFAPKTQYKKSQPLFAFFAILCKKAVFANKKYEKKSFLKILPPRHNPHGGGGGFPTRGRGHGGPQQHSPPPPPPSSYFHHHDDGGGDTDYHEEVRANFFCKKTFECTSEYVAKLSQLKIIKLLPPTTH